MKDVTFSILVYVPIIIAFAGAFHCFLLYNKIFQGPIASFIKTLTMILGEFDFQENFLYDEVKSHHGNATLIQILLIMFIIYGSFIIMNLITAWIVIYQKNVNESEIILAKQRIEEVTSATKIIDALCNSSTGNDYNIPSKLCIILYNKEEVSLFIHLWFQFKSWLDGEGMDELCIVNKHFDHENR